jgi:hypothetical protein
VDVTEPGVVRWSAGDRWTETEAQSNGFEGYSVKLETAGLPQGAEIRLEVKPQQRGSEMKAVRARVKVARG